LYTVKIYNFYLPIILIKAEGQALVAYAYIPSYSGGRHQEDCCSKPANQIVCETLPGKKQSQKRAGGMWLKV
jgi:hypothetical protein